MFYLTSGKKKIKVAFHILFEMLIVSSRALTFTCFSEIPYQKSSRQIFESQIIQQQQD